MSSDLLIEIGTEELPSGAVWPLADALATNLTAALAKAGISHGDVCRFATPRRLAVLIHEVEEKQASQAISRRGPACAVAMDADGKPLPSLLGFAKSCGVSVDALTIKKTDKGDWWVYEETRAGVLTSTLLPEMIEASVLLLPIPKPMRWGNGEVLFVRPVHWVVLLFGEEVVHTHVLGVATGRQTMGHRFHHPQALDIPTPRAYEALLKDAFVVADFNARRDMIVQQVEALASTQGCYAVMPASLVDEVTSIVEWPEAFVANFDPAFLLLPSEVLIASMQSHQKCFALRDHQGQLSPHFISVANIRSHHPLSVRMGNEKVMRARLSDAAFFYQQDRRQALSDYRPLTANVLFQAKLGSLNDKAMRMEALMSHLTALLELPPDEALRAAALSKCDLMTGMVGEFPELQGLMGYYYARHDGESDAVAQALNEQYMPRFSADVLPASVLGLALSLVDRLDTLVGLFAIGQKPTGVKDPFKLRRHALAVVRLLLATPAVLPLSMLMKQTLQAYGARLNPAEGMMEELKSFLLERLQSHMQAQGIAPDLVFAVRARQEECLFDLNKRVQALNVFVGLPDAARLSAACKRVTNVLQQASLPSGEPSIDVSLLKEPAECELYRQMSDVDALIAPYYSEGRYDRILLELASLREPVDAFFEQVMVMVDDHAIRINRLCLLTRLQGVLQGVADISLLQYGS